MVSEVVDRLAAMLDYNLAQLVGPKCQELKVKNREKYHFQPRVLLSEIIDIYLHLNCPAFVEAVARDAASILIKQRLKHADDVHALETFVNKVEEAIQCGVEEEEELGDVPDEFLDPILSSVMEDPVLLPTSGTIVDRTPEMKERIEAWKAQQKLKRSKVSKTGSSDPMDTSP
ncbi:putative ubiquitin conjugation factor E4 [Circinella umbellata]|nr:putative ubiquitin conjugation factor E4 [Circinella umbellata]KAI7847010.1 putative ubiquitin conjugation factor E4 [Circinella umbellata]